MSKLAEEFLRRQREIDETFFARDEKLRALSEKEVPLRGLATLVSFGAALGTAALMSSARLWVGFLVVAVAWFIVHRVGNGLISRWGQKEIARVKAEHPWPHRRAVQPESEKS